jgi:predicted enzyme related to lactoylglutathione lyase
VALRIVALRFDAIDPTVLARFWGAALGWAAEDGDVGVVVLVPSDESGVPIRFVPGAAPKVGQNRNHPDLTTTSFDDQRDTVERLLALGGRHVDIGQTADEDHVVLADPEGNELCVLAPGNRFLAGCGRMGAINCDGLHATGVFWSQVLGWSLSWDEGEETAVRAPKGPMITWSGPPLIPKLGPNRLSLELAPFDDSDVAGEVARLAGLGATRVDTEPDGTVLLADLDGNELRVVTPR